MESATGRDIGRHIDGHLGLDEGTYIYEGKSRSRTGSETTTINKVSTSFELDAKGGANAEWTFQYRGAITIADDSSVIFTKKGTTDM